MARVVQAQKVLRTRRGVNASGCSADLLMDLAIGNCDCTVCGSRRATERPQLPLKSMVCDQCWPVIAAELAEDSDIDEEMLA